MNFLDVRSTLEFILGTREGYLEEGFQMTLLGEMDEFETRPLDNVDDKFGFHRFEHLAVHWTVTGSVTSTAAE